MACIARTSKGNVTVGGACQADKISSGGAPRITTLTPFRRQVPHVVEATSSQRPPVYFVGVSKRKAEPSTYSPVKHSKVETHWSGHIQPEILKLLPPPGGQGFLAKDILKKIMRRSPLRARDLKPATRLAYIHRALNDLVRSEDAKVVLEGSLKTWVRTENPQTDHCQPANLGSSEIPLLADVLTRPPPTRPGRQDLNTTPCSRALESAIGGTSEQIGSSSESSTHTSIRQEPGVDLCHIPATRNAQERDDIDIGEQITVTDDLELFEAMTLEAQLNQVENELSWLERRELLAGEKRIMYNSQAEKHKAQAAKFFAEAERLRKQVLEAERLAATWREAYLKSANEANNERRIQGLCNGEIVLAREKMAKIR